MEMLQSLPRRQSNVQCKHCKVSGMSVIHQAAMKDTKFNGVGELLSENSHFLSLYMSICAETNEASYPSTPINGAN